MFSILTRSVTSHNVPRPSSDNGLNENHYVKAAHIHVEIHLFNTYIAYLFVWSNVK